MAGELLLDTNIVVAARKDDPEVIKRLDEQTRLILPVIVVGELRYAAEKSTQREHNLEEIDAFIAKLTVLSCDIGTAAAFGAVKAQLARKGKPIPDNDLWIAALAMQYDLPLVTRDKHFSFVEGIQVVIW